MDYLVTIIMLSMGQGVMHQNAWGLKKILVQLILKLLGTPPAFKSSMW